MAPSTKLRRGRALDPAQIRPIGALAAGTPGGRLSVDTQYSFFGAPHVVLPPSEAQADWRLLSLSDETLRHLPPTRLMELLADGSPEVSRALWDFLRFCNPGYTVACTRPGSADVAHPRAQAMVESFLGTLSDLYGSFDVIVGRLFMSAFLRGAFFAELVLDATGHTMIDLATPDPATVRFVRDEDPARGIIWQLSQWQNRPVLWHEEVAGYVKLDWPTIRYVAVDPFPGVPYGRALATPALFSALFLLGLLHDLRRVVAQQGYPRLDVALNVERALATMPPTLRADPAKVKIWLDETILEAQTVYRGLAPDDAYIHWDVSQVNRPVGAVNADALGAVDGLIQAIERMTTRALKTMPFLMASSQSSSETQANREWEVQAAGIKSLQHYAETLLARLFTLGLQAQGEAADVRFSFAELRAAEELRDAQTTALHIANAAAMYDRGWISQDEAALAVVGHAADAPAPRLTSTYEELDPLVAGNGGEDGEEGDSDTKGTKRMRVIRQ